MGMWSEVVVNVSDALPREFYKIRQTWGRDTPQ